MAQLMQSVLPDTARQFARAIVMPNLRPPVTTTAHALEYRRAFSLPCQQACKFEPLMTLYLTDNTSAEEIRKAKASGFVHAVKLYPAGATTNSDAGVTDLRKTYAALEEMQRCGMPLLVHGEVTNSDIDIFDREAVFIERVLQPLLKDLPNLRVVFEHITTKEAAQFVASAPDNIAATITAHHLLYNRNAMLVGGIRPHYYCLPVLKRETHRVALDARQPPVATKNSSSAPTAPRTRNTPKKTPAAAPVATPPMLPSSCMPKHSKRRVHWISWKASPVSMVRITTACRATRKPSPCARKSGKCLTRSDSASIVLCHCGRGRTMNWKLV